MSQQNVQVTVSIDSSPEKVIGFVSDVRNRAQYIQSLRSISDIQGEPADKSQTWHWNWSFVDQEFEGTGKCVEYEAGRLYSFVTEGGIASRFTYQAEPAGDGTNLTISVSFEVPEPLAKHEQFDELLASAKQRGQEAVQQLKAMLEKS